MAARTRKLRAVFESTPAPFACIVAKYPSTDIGVFPCGANRGRSLRFSHELRAASLQVHLVNPSHVSFGVGVITPRWLYVLAAAAPASSATPSSPTKPSKPSTSRRIAPGDVVGIGIHTGNALRGYEIGRAARAGRRGRRIRRHPRHALSRTKPMSSAAPTRSSRATAMWSGAQVISGLPAGHPEQIYDGGRVEAEHVHAGALGPAARRTLHVGLGADRARLPQALLVLLGVADRRPAAAPARRPMRSSRRSSSCGARGSASSRSPTTTSIRSRSTDLRQASRRADPARLEQLKAMRQERFELMERLARAAEATWCSSRRSPWRRPRIPSSSTRCARRTSRGRSSASNRSPPTA